MEPHIICDPIHGIMELHKSSYQAVKSIIDDPLFQRLRHIKQLSFAEYAFPSAVHNRFSHCIGTAYLAQKIYTTLFPKKPSDLTAITISALTHDIGHGPFSHIFEEVIKNSGLKTTHEDWSLMFMNELLNKHPDHDEDITKAIEIYKGKDHYQTLHSIIASQLDVDRFDYLLRDSHFCGVTYGNFELNWLISCMKISNNKIVVERKGVRALEHYIMARKLMNQNIYFHKIKCSSEYMFLNLIRLIKVNIDEVKSRTELTNLLIVKFIDQIISNHNQADLYKIYRELTDYDIWTFIRETTRLEKNVHLRLNDIHTICMNFTQRKLPRADHVKNGYFRTAEQIIKEEKKRYGLEPNDYCINIKKHDFGVYKTMEEEIFIEDGNYYSNVDLHSDMLSYLSGKKEKVHYVYSVENSHSPVVKTILNKLKRANCI